MGKSNRAALSIEMDFTDGYEASGFITGMTAEMKTSRYTGSVLEMAHTRMADTFDVSLDGLAANNKSQFHHVYEWRMIGIPQGRLWQHVLVGRGSVREASFSWKASTQPILTPEERMDDPLGTNDPMQNVDVEVLKKLKPRKYIFYWKAPMMEYDLTARVKPRYAKRLFVPTWRSPTNYILKDETYQDFSYANPQDWSGGDGTVNKFTTAWLGFWNQVAPGIFEREVQTVIENDIGKTAREMLTGRSRKKKVGLKTFGGRDEYDFAAFESGRNRAEALVRGKAKSYSKASKYIDKNGQFGIDVNYGK